MLRLRPNFSRVCAVSAVALLCAVSSNAQEKVELRLRLAEGQTFDHIVAIQQKSSQTISSVRMDQTETTRFRLRNEVTQAQIDIFTIKSTYQSVVSEGRMSTALGNDELSLYDSTKPKKTASPVTQMMDAIVGQSFTTTFNARGDVLKIEGLEALVQRMVTALKVPKDERVFMSKSLEQSMKSQSEQLTTFPGFPQAAVAVGESWEMESTQTSLAPVLISANYTLTALQNNIATLNLRAQIKANPKPQVIETPEVRISYELSGAQNGVLRVDSQSGLSRDFELHQRLTGRVSMTDKIALTDTRTGKKLPNAQMSWPMYMKTTIRGWTIPAR